MSADDRPLPHDLWRQANGDRARYTELLLKHGWVVKNQPGAPAEALPCGWPLARRDFERQYRCEPVESDRQQHDLWACYLFVTECFDRTACTGPIRDDSIMPANEVERAVINVHASGVRQVARERGAEWPIGGMVQRLSFAELGAIAEKYPEICDAMVARGRSTVEAWWRRRRGGP
jgi:hypothetical protein